MTSGQQSNIVFQPSLPPSRFPPNVSDLSLPAAGLTADKRQLDEAFEEGGTAAREAFKADIMLKIEQASGPMRALSNFGATCPPARLLCRFIEENRSFVRIRTAWHDGVSLVICIYVATHVLNSVVVCQ